MSSVQASHGALQRTCAWGLHTMGVGQCAECQKRQVNGKPLQKKSAMSEPGDVYEQGADRVADQVMRMTDAEMTCQSSQIRSQQVQRLAASGRIGVMETPPSVHDVLNSPGQLLDATIRAFFEPRFGHDFSRVRVHTDEQAGRSSQDVNAQAYSIGHNIVFGAGQYAPKTADGRRLIAHELTHVLQQKTTGHGVTGNGSLGIQRQGVKGNSKPPRTETEGCDPSLQSDLKSMHHPARDHVERAIVSLDPGWKGMTPANRAAFSQYFDPANSGQIDNGFVSTVREKYKLIHSTMRSLRFDCDPSSWTLCGTSKKWCVGGRLMWTCFGNLHVCSNAYKTATLNHKIETIIHESVHNALLTTDRAYSNEPGFKGLSPRGTGFWGRVLNFLSNIPVLGTLFRLLPGNNDTMNNPDSYAGYAMQV